MASKWSQYQNKYSITIFLYEYSSLLSRRWTSSHIWSSEWFHNWCCSPKKSAWRVTPSWSCKCMDTWTKTWYSFRTDKNKKSRKTRRNYRRTHWLCTGCSLRIARKKYRGARAEDSSQGVTRGGRTYIYRRWINTALRSFGNMVSSSSRIKVME